MVLVFASNNAHKLEEVRAIMPEGVEVLSLRDIGFNAEIEETGTTLEENSRIKAETVADFIKMPTPDNVLRTATGSPIGQSPSPVKGGENVQRGSVRCTVYKEEGRL